VNGLIFDVQGHSVHDGPGCRTLVFLSGCPLRCQWCANPEGLQVRPQLLFRERLCRACPTRCVDACPHGAIAPAAARPSDNSQNANHAGARPLIAIDRTPCTMCSTLDCVRACYPQALQASGREWTVDALMRVLSRDRQYWGPDGGVTFGGGDPLAQKTFLMAMLERCHEAAMHVAIETSAAVPTFDLLDILPLVSWLFVDLKHIDNDRHMAGTGRGNGDILANISALARSAWPGRLVVRTTIVPGYNDDGEQASAAASFLTTCGVREVQLLPFHRLGASKYVQLGLPYAYAGCAAVDADQLASLARIYREAGLDCHTGTQTPF
jgi:pyruvate formate lyase activating enzyme